MSAPSITAIGTQGEAGTTAYTANFTVTNGTRQRSVVGSIEEGQQFIATTFQVTTVQDPGGDFDVALFNGDHRVAPENGKATMTVDEVAFPAVELYNTGSEITVELDAQDRASDIDVTIQVGGVEPEKAQLLVDLLP